MTVSPLPPLGLGVAGRAAGGRGAHQRTHRRTDARTATAPPPRRPGGARRAGRGRGAAERTGSNRRRRRTGSGNEPANPALCTSPGSLHFRDQTRRSIISGARDCVRVHLHHFRNSDWRRPNRLNYTWVLSNVGTQARPSDPPPSTPTTERDRQTHWTQKGLHK